MGDDSRPLISGDRWNPTASQLNRLQETADYIDSVKRSGGSLANPQNRRELGAVVLVKNESATEETWPIWSPVGVCPPPGNPLDNAIRFANRPYFRGCRLDDYSFDDGMYRKLGITQEPIPYGKTGRVAIAGVTPALIQDANAAGYYSRSDGRWAMVRKHDGRWTLRLGPGGDARVITFLDSAVYQDGTYNDQVLALVDISTPPHRVDICNNSGSTLASCSTTITTVRTTPSGDTTVGEHYYNVSIAPDAIFVYNNFKPIATAGWDIPTGKHAWGYFFNPTVPVCSRFVGKVSIVYSYYGIAPQSTRLYPGLPGLIYHSSDWIDWSNPRAWFLTCPPGSGVYYAKATGNMTSNGDARYRISGYPLVDHNLPAYDGVSELWVGETLPLIVKSIRPPDNMHVTGTIQPKGIARALNIQDGHVVRVHYGKHSSSSYGGIYADAAFFDAPVGSIRAWFYSDIPDGWRLCDGTGGTIDLRGRFIMGINTDAGAPSNENSIGDTGGYRYHGYTENQHQKPMVGVGGTGSTALANIDPDADDDTDNRPPFCVVAYIQRVEPWTQAS